MITDTIVLEKQHCGLVPKDPWKFGHDIMYAQKREEMTDTQNILFNKGRYFECTVRNQEVREFVAAESGARIEYTNMVVGNWKVMEGFVQAMNKKGFYVNINIDWI